MSKKLDPDPDPETERRKKLKVPEKLHLQLLQRKIAKNLGARNL